MDKKLEFYLRETTMNESGSSETFISELENQIGFKFPQDYVTLMKEFSGAEGDVGENGWLCLFPIEDLLIINNDYSLLMEQIPDYFLFGKDAADTGYAFHKINQTIHSFGLMSDFKTDRMEFCGNDFIEFAAYLYNQ